MSNSYIKKVYKGIAEIKLVNGRVIGYIEFNEEVDGPTHIIGELEGLQPGEHGIHIHEKGDSRNCCDALGGHYNPFNKTHGYITAKERHVGDMGNINANEFGKCKFLLKDNLIKINGPYSVIGRSVVVHEHRDDLGLGGNPESKKTGNSGKRIAYGVIGYA